jgi:hypothetical protein
MIDGVGPGRYQFRAPGNGWTIRSVTIGRRDYTDIPIEVGDGGLDGVSVVVTTDGARVRGRIKVGPQDLAEGTSLLIFPLELEYRLAVGRLPRRIRVGAVATSGVAEIQDVPAGDYYVLAVRGHQADRWWDPEFLATAEAYAERIHLDWGSTREITLPVRVFR